MPTWAISAAKPIRRAWLWLVLPSLLANYYGQGALLLTDASALENPFFRLAPDWALYPLVALATIATVIASQATISGAFSMAQQAALLGLSPRVRDPAHLGQRVRPDLRAGGELAAAGRRGGAGAVLQVVDQPRRGLRHRRHRHHADDHHPGVRAGGARLEMELGAGDPGVLRAS